MSDDPYETEGWGRFVNHVRKDALEKIAGSEVFVTVGIAGSVDLRVAVELGIAVLLDKPIVAIGSPGSTIPPGVRRIAHRIVETAADVDTEEGQEELRRKIEPILEELGK